MILVIGKTGQVARELARLVPQAPRAHADATPMRVQEAPDRSMTLADTAPPLEALFLSREELDLGTPEAAAARLSAMIAEAGAQAVINTAAYTAVDKAEAEPDVAHVVNAEAPGALARVCAARSLPFVHISTDYVFDGSGTEPRATDEVPGPLSVYAKTKLAGERAVADAGGVHAVLRTSWVFSAHGANFVKTMLRLSETRHALSIVADQIGGPTPAAAVAQACIAIAGQLRRDPGLSGTYHFSGTPDVSWAGFARAIFAAADREVAITEIPTADYPTPATRPLNSRLDCSATQAAFGLLRPDWRGALPDVLSELAKGKA